MFSFSTTTSGTIDEELSHLYREYLSPLLHQAYGFGLSKPDAEDCVAETFFRVFRLMHRRPGHLDVQGADVLNYLRTVLRNVIRSYGKRRRREIHDELPDDYPDGASDDPLADHLHVQLAEERAYQIISAMDELYRDPLILKFYYDLSNKEIAGLLGLSENLVAQRIRRGREKLVKAIGNDIL